jgi:ABC-type Fe3+-hydroxamate transport system substrate-binding protein
MGYYTVFNLEVVGGDSTYDYVQELQDISGYTNLFDDCVKWYDHEYDMRLLSEKYPEVLFILSGEGEDLKDIWKEYYKNGLMQRTYAEIIFEDFDETKLE